jgi:hypothetical protein
VIDWTRRHALAIGVVVFGAAFFALFTWAEYGYWCDQGRDHGQTACPSFWTTRHLHDWIYNAASNWQSELLVGIGLLVVLNKLEGPRGADRDDT